MFLRRKNKEAERWKRKYEEEAKRALGYETGLKAYKEMFFESQRKLHTVNPDYVKQLKERNRMLSRDNESLNRRIAELEGKVFEWKDAAVELPAQYDESILIRASCRYGTITLEDAVLLATYDGEHWTIEDGAIPEDAPVKILKWADIPMEK